MTNDEIAQALQRLASLLDLRGEISPHRARAYRQAAFALQLLTRPAAQIYKQQGRAGLERIEGIGPGLAARIEELLTTRHIGLLDELVEDLGPTGVLQTVPRIGPALANSVHRQLGVETLDDLERAARSGELSRVPGIGPGKARQILESLERARARRAGRMEAGMDNREIAEILFKVASLLDAREQTNPFRVQAYRRAAASIQSLDRPAEQIYHEAGLKGMQEIQGVGPNIAARIEELLTTGRLKIIEQLVDELGPEALFQTVPGVGPTLAKRIRQELNITTLDELEGAARTHELERAHGIGPAKETQILQSIARMRERAREAPRRRPPSVAELLEVDEEYRRRAAAGELPTIAPKRFNPTGERWLPLLNTQRGPRKYTAVYSNTQAAHEAGKTRDWVVLYWKEPGLPDEEQCTVVTETHGDLRGLRVVRGHEDETRAHYAQRGALQPA